MQQDKLETAIRKALEDIPVSKGDIKIILPKLLKINSFISHTISSNSSFFHWKDKIETTATLVGTSNSNIRTLAAYIYGDEAKGLANFFRGSRKLTEKRVCDYYTDLFNRTGKGEKILRAAHKNGLISEMPDLSPGIA